MKSVVVYDSWTNNTLKIAEAIADGLDNDVRVTWVKRNPLRYLEDCELLIVGSPTHGGVATPAMQEFLESLHDDDLEGVAVAAFDTRATYKWLKVIGFAAKRIAKTLQQKGGTLLAAPVGFYVDGKEGPLAEGEIDRAREWGRELAKQIKGAPV